MPSRAANRIVIVTSYPGHFEPRAPRHARAFAELHTDEVVFLDTASWNQPLPPLAVLDQIPNLRRVTHRFPLRTDSPPRWLTCRLRSLWTRYCFRLLGVLSGQALNWKVIGLEQTIASLRPRIIMAHNIDTLLPAFNAARRCGAALLFDSMEFHSDMGDEQDSVMMRLIETIESRCLPACRLVTTSSHRVAAALHDKYGITSTLALYNTPRIVRDLPRDKSSGFTLYWRNATIGLGQRGLADAIQALAILPNDVSLHLQGRLPFDGGAAVLGLAKSLGVEPRVILEPPYQPQDAVVEASRFHVGLCLERAGIRNHDLTVSNKMFDYHMAGLAVVSSDRPALRDILDKSQGGFLYESGNAASLAAQVKRLYDDPGLYNEKATNARRFALTEGNLESDMQRFQQQLRKLSSEPLTDLRL